MGRSFFFHRVSRKLLFLIRSGNIFLPAQIGNISRGNNFSLKIEDGFSPCNMLTTDSLLRQKNHKLHDKFIKEKLDWDRISAMQLEKYEEILRA